VRIVPSAIVADEHICPDLRINSLWNGLTLCIVVTQYSPRWTECHYKVFHGSKEAYEKYAESWQKNPSLPWAKTPKCVPVYGESIGRDRSRTAVDKVPSTTGSICADVW
jgi:hypothetical protein